MGLVWWTRRLTPCARARKRLCFPHVTPEAAIPSRTARTAEQVRELRLRVLRDGASATLVARETGAASSYIWKCCRWELWAETDHDLKHLRRTRVLTARADDRRCPQCIHWLHGHCTLEFPDSKFSTRYANKCHAFRQSASGS
jgi:hypothetical protein